MAQDFFRTMFLSKIFFFTSTIMMTSASSMELNKDDLDSQRLPVVLSLDGGGIRGIAQIHLLQKIEQELTLKNPEARIYDYVDFFAGTSIGGINTIGVSSKITLKKIKKIYIKAKETIFLPEPWSFGGLLKYKYQANGLKNTLIKLIGEDTSFSQIKKPVSIISYDTKACQTIHINNWDEAYEGAKLWDVALATSSAPHYFPPHLFQNKISCMDGGLGENNPILSGIDSAYRLNPCTDPIVISIGTGRVQEPLSYKRVKGMSILGIGENILNMMFNANSSTMNYHAQKMCKPENYFRFQFDLAPGHEGIDDYTLSNLEYLCKEADQMAQGDLFKKLIKKLTKNEEKKKSEKK